MRHASVFDFKAQFLHFPVHIPNLTNHRLIYNGDIECGGVVDPGIYSFSKSRNRNISLPAAAKSPCSESSRSRNRLMSLWHVYNKSNNFNYMLANGRQA